tara:strand:- start:76 stop:507 length:432 start_codon:yes stop_codon:yes gene_type:complete
MNNRLSLASKSYDDLKEQFVKFISNPEAKLSKISSLQVHPSEGHILLIEAFGRLLEFRFSLVFQSDIEVLGQSTVFYIQNPDNYLRTETPVASIWFDSLGNVKDTPTSFSSHTTSDERSLFLFVNTTLGSFLNTQEFSPREHG